MEQRTRVRCSFHFVSRDNPDAEERVAFCESGRALLGSYWCPSRSLARAVIVVTHCCKPDHRDVDHTIVLSTQH